MTGMTRYAHFVGTLPAALTTDDRAAIQWIADQADGHPLTAIPRDLDPSWIVDYLRSRAQQTDVFEVVRPGEFGDYEDFPHYRRIAGRRLEPRHVAMGRVERIDEVVSAFADLQARRPELAGTRLQLSQPNPLDLALFVLASAAVSAGLPVGPALRRSNLVVAALRELPVFTDAVLGEVAEVTARHGNRVVWQLESPIALLSLVKAEQLHARWALVGWVARQLAGILGRMHDIGADTIVHLCYGDLEHQSLLAPRSLAPAVNLLDRTARQLRRQGKPLPPVHVPCAFGAEPAPLDPLFYAPLSKLDPAWRIVAGVVSPDSADDSARALAMFEQAAGRTAWGVATACGLGRCTVPAAEQAAATMFAVAGAAARHA
jgi:hypothetical protein